MRQSSILTYTVRTVPGREEGIGQGCTEFTSREKARFKLQVEGVARKAGGIN